MGVDVTSKYFGSHGEGNVVSSLSYQEILVLCNHSTLRLVLYFLGSQEFRHGFIGKSLSDFELSGVDPEVSSFVVMEVVGSGK
jgi:hypothetical protein